MLILSTPCCASHGEAHPPRAFGSRAYRRALLSHAVFALGMLALTAASAAQQPVAPAATAAGLLSPFQQKALLAASPSGLAFHAVTLTATVDRTAGSTKESGTIKFHAASDGATSEDWTGAGADRSIHCSALSGERSCTLQTATAKASPLQGIESERPLPWFAPWIGLYLTSGSLATATEQVLDNGTRVTFAPAYSGLSSLPAKTQDPLQQIANAAKVEVLFDAATALPASMHYTLPLSSEPSNAIDVLVVYSDYRLEGGAMLPHHIQRYLQRTLEADVHISSVTLD